MFKFLKAQQAVFFLLIFQNIAFSQDKVAFGGGLSYNLGIRTVGAGLRAQVPIIEKLYLSPSVNYSQNFSSIVSIKEVYTGIAIQYHILQGTTKQAMGTNFVVPKKPSIYASLGVDYNYWINYQPTSLNSAKQHNVLPIVSAGIIYGTYKFRGYLESKYNPLWNEGHVNLGILVYPFHFKRANKCP
jgi:hypothetical protein